MPWLFNIASGDDELVDLPEGAPIPPGYESLAPEGRAPRPRPPAPPTYRPFTRIDETLTWETYRELTRGPTLIATTTMVRAKTPGDEDNEMATPNKEPIPLTIPHNPLNNIATYQVSYSLQLYKDIVAAIRAGKTTVPMRFAKPRPNPPKINAANPYTPRYDVKKPSSFDKPFKNWQRHDEFRNKIDEYDVRKVPAANVEIWEKYREALIKWETSQGNKEEVPLQWVFKFLQNKITYDWGVTLDAVAKNFNNVGTTLWEQRFTQFNKGKEYRWGDIDAIIRVVYHSNKWDSPNYHQMAREMPPEVRPRRATNLSGEFFRRHIIEYFQKLYRIRYREEMPENTLFWNTWHNVIDFGGDGIIQVDNITGIDNHTTKYTVPRRYAEEFLVVPCVCCEKIGDAGRMYWVSPKHKAQIIFRNPVNVEARKKKRQEDFLKSYKPEKKEGKYYSYPASALKDMSKVPTHIHGIIKFLNDHIDSFDKNKKPVADGDVDEYGINHVELDSKEMAFTNIKYLGAGWADTSNRSKYIMVCQLCFMKLSQEQPTRADRRREEARYGVIEDDPGVRHNPLRRNRNSVIMRHGSSPFDYLGRNYMLGKGEQRRMVAEKIFNGKRMVEDRKDATLYMGVELEVCPEDDLYQNHMIKRCGFSIDDYGWTPLYNDVTWVAANVVDRFAKFKKQGIIVFDRSTGNGFELVTLPGTHRWHMEEAWNGFFKEDYDDPEMAALAPASFVSGWVNNGQPTKFKYITNATGDKGQKLTNRPSCGIHIHFSRDAVTPLQLGKIKYFINTHTKFIEHIAGRTSEQYSRYVPSKVKDGTAMAKNKKGNTAPLAPMEGRGDNGVDRSRYVALNLNTGKPTFEVRIFRANVSKAGFMKNIDFVHALIVWCGTAAPMAEKNITPAAFCNWMEDQRGQYKWLTKWLIHNKYMTSIHKFTPGKTREFDFVDNNAENEITPRMVRRV